MVERVLVVVRRDDEPADGTGIVRVGKMPRVVRLGLSVCHRKSSSGVSGGRRRGDSSPDKPRKRRPLETYLGVSKLGLARRL